MQSQDLQSLKEVQKTNNIQLQSQTEFIVRPTGEVQVKGNPDPELIRQLMVSADYQKDQDRRYKSEIERQQKQVDFMVVGFLGCTFLLSIFCLFLTINQRNQTQGASNNGESFRGISCQQIR